MRDTPPAKRRSIDMMKMSAHPRLAVVPRGGASSRHENALARAHPARSYLTAIPRWFSLFIGTTIVIAAGCAMPSKKNAPAESWATVTVVEDFKLDTPGEAWSFRTPALWRVTEDGGRRLLQMAFPPQRPMLPGVRRPQEFAVYNRYEFRSFSLACYVRIDREVSVRGRDACILFGRQDDTHYYYAHLSNIADAYHNNLIRVDGLTRESLLKVGTAQPAILDGDWHRVDVLRDVDAGTICVFVDRDRATGDVSPLFEVADKTYEWGFIAFGSFDDHASFGPVAIEGQARKPTRPVDLQ